ncbi:hypothetical protein GUJ93_ZPchr0004g40501 [Zizania palustris]|uniref:Uncharacterized protein n=1 Tax=Zizania palustris TaxID=103762 RepID=A0A8J5SEE5_ZIZPA|nr:hypothetical protein GUJ93_ZPchr0004g40501 [Zizania palustris]
MSRYAFNCHSKRFCLSLDPTFTEIDLETSPDATVGGVVTEMVEVEVLKGTVIGSAVYGTHIGLGCHRHLPLLLRLPQTNLDEGSIGTFPIIGAKGNAVDSRADGTP